ncbi:DNA-binding protein [Aestuariivirga sp.]|uniref:DNA-binding protein n=1 Tax=Aestuariivirga sp. TaxID=2650926 RepID=UPI0039E4BB3C
MAKQPLAYSRTEAAHMACCGLTTLHEAIAVGALRAKKLGRKTLIMSDDLEAWLNSLPSAKEAA